MILFFKKYKIPLRKVLLVTLRHVVKSMCNEVKAMSKHTTGEILKVYGVTVQTVQYYDTRGILIPSELSKGRYRGFCVEVWGGTVK